MFRDGFVLEKKAEWDLQRQGKPRTWVNPAKVEKTIHPPRKVREPGPPAPVRGFHPPGQQPGHWATERSPVIWNTMGYHTSTLSHDVLFEHQGPQWIPPPPVTPPVKVDAPKTVRPSTQLGFELRARRRNNDWGLGEGGRPRREADISVNKRFPLWGCVDGKVMQHEKPSALEALEELKANEEVYRAGETKRKNMYATAKDVDTDSKTFRILSTNAEAGGRGPGSGTGIGNGRGVSASATVTRALPRLAEEASASHRVAARAAAAHLYVRQQEEETRRRRQGREAVGPGSGSTVGDGGHGDAMAPRRGAHKRQPSEAKNDPRIAELTREMYELAGVTAQLAAFREQRQGTLAAADALAASGSLLRLPSPNTLRGRRTIIDRRHAEIAGKVNAKLEAAMSEKTARCVALSGTLTAEYGDLSNLV